MDQDKYLLKKYGITTAERAQMETEQGGVCAICGRPAGGSGLRVDHDHKVAQFKILTTKTSVGWFAWITELVLPGPAYGYPKRMDAVRAARLALLRASIRGLLCWTCNQGIGKFNDKPERLANAAAYLMKFNKKIKDSNGQVN